MASNMLSVNVYQINSLDPIPLASVQKFVFPFAGIMIRPINNPTTQTPGLVLSTGAQVYSMINVLATGMVCNVVETPAVLAGMSN